MILSDQLVEGWQHEQREHRADQHAHDHNDGEAARGPRPLSTTNFSERWPYDKNSTRSFDAPAIEHGSRNTNTPTAIIALIGAGMLLEDARR